MIRIFRESIHLLSDKGMKSEINLLIGLVLIVVTGLLVFGCRTKDHETNAALTIHIDERNIILDKVTYSDLVRVVEVIPLETNNESIFAKADKVIVTDNNIYILDERRSNAVFIFTRQGLFIRKLQGSGKGPQEFIRVSDIVFNKWANELMLLDGYKINLYSPEGTFLRSIPLEKGAFHFYLINDHTIALSSQSLFHIYIIDFSGKIINKYLEFEPDFQMIKNKPFIGYKEEVYFTRFIDNNIYSISEDKAIPAIFIDFGTRALSREAYLNIPMTGMDRRISQDYMYNIRNFEINSTHILFYFSFQSKGYFALYNKINKQVFITKSISIEDDLFAGGLNIHSISATYKDHFVGLIEPAMINEDKMTNDAFKNIRFNSNDNEAILIYDFIK